MATRRSRRALGSYAHIRLSYINGSTEANPVISRLTGNSSGRINPVYIASAISLLVLTGLVYLLAAGSSPRRPEVAGGEQELIIYCAAGLRVPVEQIADDYERECGVSIRLQYGGSNTLLSQLEIANLGDLYLAADESYILDAQKKGLVAESLSIARMTPVMITRRDNPKDIADVDDLLRSDVRVALANPDQAAVGRLTRACLQSVDRWDELEERVRAVGVFKPTVNDVATDVALGSVDAGVVWDSVALQFADLQVSRVAPLDEGSVLVSVGVLKATKNAPAALRFARFLTARDRGLGVFEKLGYAPVDGDRWAESPRLTVYAGAVNRKTLGPIVEAFRQRHGVDVETVYNGCGILTAQMRAIGTGESQDFPDAFMACDVYYMEEVSDMFRKSVNVSDTPIVIAVQAGNPKQIASIDDLAKPGVRVALGQPEQCTIGVLSRRLLESAGIYDAVLVENVVTQTATSSLLIPSIATGAADAALVYLSDAQAEADNIDVVSIDSPLARAIQPYSIAKSSDFPRLGRMLFDEIARSRDAFEAAGFKWRLSDE